MKRFPVLLLLVWLCTSTGMARAQDPVAWLSYRDQYRAMLWFEKYAQPKHLIQNHLQVQGDFSKLRLSLVGKSIRLDLPLDDSGRTVLPLLKAQYDENAELHLNQKLDHLSLKPRVSIAQRPDGIYELSDLRAACQQVQDYQNWRDASVLRGKKCSGVRFVFSKKSSVSAPQLRKLDQSLQAWPLLDGVAFWGDQADGKADSKPDSKLENKQGDYLVATFNFASLPDKGQVLTRSAPVAIAAWFE